MDYIPFKLSQSPQQTSNKHQKKPSSAMHASPIVRALQNANRQAQRNNSECQGHPVSNEGSLLHSTAHVTNSEDGEIEPQEVNTEHDPPTVNGRNLQHVIPDIFRYHIVTWMINDASSNGEKGLKSRTVKEFPHHFRSSYNANIMRASRYWNMRHEISSRHDGRSHSNSVSFTSATNYGIKKHYSKARPGRGRKRSPWVSVLYDLLYAEFDRLRKTGLRFESCLLRQLAIDIITNSAHPLCHNGTVDSERGIPIKELIRPMWISRFMQHNNIVCRTQTGKLMVSPAKRELIDRQVAFHLGELAREFQSGDIREEDIFNSDETHFIVHLHSNRTLAVRGETKIKYADVVSGDDGMTMMVTLGGRCMESVIPMMIFKNPSRSYPIRGLPDDIPGVSYRSGPKGFMDSALFAEWLNESRIFKPLPDGRTRVLYVDNCSAHRITADVEAALTRSRTVLRFFPPCATDLVQPADSFVIQRIKSEWRSRWDKKEMEMISNNMWSDPSRSGRLVNPGKRYFLQLAADVARSVFQQRDSDGVLFTRKAMIRCGMALNLNGVWEERQLSPELQNIIKKYRENFNGTPVGTCDNSVLESNTVGGGVQ